MLITGKIYSNGRTLISKPVREALGVTEGDLIEIRVGGYTTTVPLRSTDRLSIPKGIRDELSLEAGDLVEIDVSLPSD